MTPSISKALLVAGLNTWIMPTIKIGVGLAGLFASPGFRAYKQITQYAWCMKTYQILQCSTKKQDRNM
jgi:hypothetical protein